MRAVDSQLSVGGPATAGLAWVSEFVNFTDAGKSVPASFVSTHSYPTDLRHGSFTRTQFEDQIIAQAEVAEGAGLPFVLTETSAGLNNACVGVRCFCDSCPLSWPLRTILPHP